MKQRTFILSCIIVAMVFSNQVFAGNQDRAGQSGGNELLINPWARSSGWGGANSASITGLESTTLNVAGLAFTHKTELLFARTSWLKGSDININSFGLAQKVGETGVLGLSIMNMNFGEIDITTVNNPEGGNGTFSPQFLNIGLSYARNFSNSISGGLTARIISESINNAKAAGVSLDAGVRYVTGPKDNVKFGIALRNVGPKMQFSGDGFSLKNELNGVEYTSEHRRAPFELPSALNIGASYDLYIMQSSSSDTTASEEESEEEDDKIKSDHRITFAGTFTSNSFGKDQIRFGIEYGFKTYFMVRAGWVHEEGIYSAEDRTTAHTGPTVGATVEVPLSKKSNTTFGLDYSYRFTNPFQGTHAIGIRIDI